MLYKYSDEYLEITKTQEDTAIKDVKKLGITDEYYTQKLTILRAYILCCLENQTVENDLFEIKLKHYKSEFKEILDDALIFEKGKKKGIESLNLPLGRG